MPDVNPSGSSHPPVSGNVEDPQSLPKPHQSDGQVICLPYEVNCTGTSGTSEETSVPLPNPEHDVETGEVDERPPGSSTDRPHENVSNKSRKEAVKEIGISSTTFIGPACRPQPAIEDELSEFYRELEQINNQDTVDGDRGSPGGIPRACVPSVKPSSRKETHGNDHRNTYRPYSQANSHAACQQEDWNSQRWTRSPRYMTYDDPNPFKDSQHWQPPTLRLPHGPPSFQFHLPRPAYFSPNPNLCAPPPHFEAQMNHLRHPGSSARSSWEENQFTADGRSDYTGSVTQYERDTADWWDYEGHHEDQHHGNNDLVLILMRGLPGSGKSTLARELMSTGPSGLILSTDDYFYYRNGYFFQPSQLAVAHDWNQNRARQAMAEGRSPVIVDNTNVMAWEMKPYVALALERGYKVEFVEPDTMWKCDPVELERRNKHGVLRDSIGNMLDRFDFPISVDIVMRSSEPPHKSKEPHSRQLR